MKVLSLRNPWAWMVVHGGKSIENRKWNTKFRGEFLIHASKTMTLLEYANAIRWALERGLNANINAIPEPACLDFGGIIGKARLVRVVPPHPVAMGQALQNHPAYACSELNATQACWHMHEQYGFVLEDVQPLPFTPCRGSLNFFRAPDAVLAQLGLHAHIASP